MPGSSPGEAAWTIDRAGLDVLLEVLRRRGLRTLGPVVRDGAVVHGDLSTSADLPVGCHDEQAPGTYRLRRTGDGTLFGWAVGPASWKSAFFPPHERLWQARPSDGATIAVTEERPVAAPVALVGARPCEVVALDILDRVLAGAGDRGYISRRQGGFVVVAECGAPASTCFCTSMGTGPAADTGFDLALTELPSGDGTRLVVRVGSDVGASVLAEVPRQPATAEDLRAREHVVGSARTAITRRLDTDGLVSALAAALDHPRWDAVAERCLSCGNCTLVCPTCFCSDVDDVSQLDGTVERRRRWASCFDIRHSYLHAGPTRPTIRSRYRQWATHKLSTWWDQFGTSGCVGCGRCITWCPVGIDITEEVSAITGPTSEGEP